MKIPLRLRIGLWIWRLKNFFKRKCKHPQLELIPDYSGAEVISKDPRDPHKSLLGDQIDTIDIVCVNCRKLIYRKRIVMDHIYKIHW